MVTRGHSSQAGGGGFIIEGVDEIVHSFVRQATTVAPKAGVVAVLAASKAAQRMKARVPIGPPNLHVINSVTADHTPTVKGGGVYADAGPDPAADAGAFVARFLEHGTVKMSPRPFMGPAGDETLPEFIEGIRKLADL